MRSEGPSPSWYEPSDEIEADMDPSFTSEAGDRLVIAHGIVSWSAGHPDDD